MIDDVDQPLGTLADDRYGNLPDGQHAFSNALSNYNERSVGTRELSPLGERANNRNFDGIGRQTDMYGMPMGNGLRGFDSIGLMDISLKQQRQDSIQLYPTGQ